jgi:hypothetical protein
MVNYLLITLSSIIRGFGVLGYSLIDLLLVVGDAIIVHRRYPCAPVHLRLRVAHVPDRLAIALLQAIPGGPPLAIRYPVDRLPPSHLDEVATHLIAACHQ